MLFKNIRFTQKSRHVQSKDETIIGNTQIGFRKGCGTIEAVIVITTSCKHTSENGKKRIQMLCGFLKCFSQAGLGEHVRDPDKKVNSWPERQETNRESVYELNVVVEIQQEMFEGREIGRAAKNIVLCHHCCSMCMMK